MGKKCINLTRLNTLPYYLKLVRSMLMKAHLWSRRLSFQSMIKVMLPAILSLILLLSMLPFEAQVSSGQSKLSLYTTNPAMNNKLTSSNTATLAVTSESPALTIVKSASPTTYSTVGQTITYTYTVTNSGNANIKGPINIIDSRINGSILIPNTDLAPGQSITGTSNYSITQEDINSGSVTISVYVKILMIV